MKKIKTVVAVMLISAFAISGTGCNMVSKTDAAKRKAVVAKVYGKNITNGEVVDRMGPYMAQAKASGTDLSLPANKDQLTEAKTTMLKQIVQETIINKKAVDLKVVPETKALNDEIDKQITGIKANYSNDDTKFNDALKTYGYTLDTLKSEVKFSIIQGKVAEYLVKDKPVTDADAQKYYDDNKALKFHEQNDSFNIANALFASGDPAAAATTTPAPDALTKAETAAKAALARIKAGEKFETIADEVNTDSTKDKGGDLGVYYYDDSLNQQKLMTEFFDAATKLTEGQVSEPVKTSYGYHLIKVTKIQKFPVKSFDTVKEEIKTTLLNEKKSAEFQTEYTKWETEAKVVTDKYKTNL